mmetsp:Transcript_52646/g.123158  ORF Transcript_52646/g.123158 Transcript_52646/m.123158 type:complete len:327 (+) Transcript_52646:329-1309(+)
MQPADLGEQSDASWSITTHPCLSASLTNLATAPFSSFTFGIALGSCSARRAKLRATTVASRGTASAVQAAEEKGTWLNLGTSSKALATCRSATLSSAATTASTRTSSASAFRSSSLHCSAQGLLFEMLKTVLHKVENASSLASSPQSPARSPTSPTAVTNEALDAVLLSISAASESPFTRMPCNAACAAARSGFTCLGASRGAALLSAIAARSLQNCKQLSGSAPTTAPCWSFAGFNTSADDKAQTRSSKTGCAEATANRSFLAPFLANGVESSTASLANCRSVGSTSLPSQCGCRPGRTPSIATASTPCASLANSSGQGVVVRHI